MYIRLCPFTERTTEGASRVEAVAYLKQIQERMPEDLKAKIGDVQLRGQLNCSIKGLVEPNYAQEIQGTMKEIISGGREASASGGFFQGGLGGMAQGNWRTYGCWRKHACLDALNAAGIDTTGDAICYKFNSAQHSWFLPHPLNPSPLPSSIFPAVTLHSSTPGCCGDFRARSISSARVAETSGNQN